MGAYLSSPLVTKEVASGGVESLGLRWALCSMQGWRISMEDAHVVLYAKRQTGSSESPVVEEQREAARAEQLSDGGVERLLPSSGREGESALADEAGSSGSSSTALAESALPFSAGGGLQASTKKPEAFAQHSSVSPALETLQEGYVFIPVEQNLSLSSRIANSVVDAERSSSPLFLEGNECATSERREDFFAEEDSMVAGQDADTPAQHSSQWKSGSCQWQNSSATEVCPPTATPLSGSSAAVKKGVALRTSCSKLRQFSLLSRGSASAQPAPDASGRERLRGLDGGERLLSSFDENAESSVGTEGLVGSLKGAGSCACAVLSSGDAESQGSLAEASNDQKLINLSIFAVFDGHGGAHVSRFAAFHLQELLEQQPAFHRGDLATALRSAYLMVDELLRQESCQEELLFLATHTLAQLQKQKLQQQPKRTRLASPPAAQASRVRGAVSPSTEGFSNSLCQTASRGGGGGLRAQLSALTHHWSRTHHSPKQQGCASQPPEEGAIVERLSSSSAESASVDGGDSGCGGAPEQASSSRRVSGHLEPGGDGGATAARGGGLRSLGKGGGSGGVSALSSSPFPSSSAATNSNSQQQTPPPGRISRRGVLASLVDVAVKFLTFGKGFPARGAGASVASQGNNAGGQAVRSLARAAGCTALTVCVTEDSVVVANVGDSRCVLCRGGEALELSQDHKPQLAEERIRIYAAGGYLEMGRVNGNLNLSRALGDLVYKSDASRPPERQIVSSVPDVLTLKRDKEADEFLIIGCDGIWETLSSAQRQDLAQILRDLFDVLISPNPSIYELGCDNMTAFIVDLRPTERAVPLASALSS